MELRTPGCELSVFVGHYVEHDFFCSRLASLERRAVSATLV